MAGVDTISVFEIRVAVCSILVERLMVVAGMLRNPAAITVTVRLARFAA
jgi:hypothetical protein